MTTVGFSPEFRDQVEDGRKCRDYRMAKCIHNKNNLCKHGDINPGMLVGVSEKCILTCKNYEYRIKTGDKIHAYTGLRQKLYCTNKYSELFGKLISEIAGCDVSMIKCSVCEHQGAKLLRPDLPKCIDTYPIKLKNITEEDARLDGFKQDWQKDTCPSCGECNYDEVIPGDAGKWDRKQCDECTPLNKLNRFFINTYNAKPDTPIQAIIWEELKGDKAGK